MKIMKEHFVSLKDFSQKEIYLLLKRAIALKKVRQSDDRPLPLKDKILGLIFEKPSLRTRVTFEVGMRELGGDSLLMGAQEVQLGDRESVGDVARNLERWIDGIVLRTFRHEVLEEFARFSSIPVINGLTDLLHPCQILSDMLTLFEKKEYLEGLHLAYVGDGNNVANSWLIGAAIMGMNVTIACPEKYGPNPEILKLAAARAKETGAKLRITDNPVLAVTNADVIYTDVWTSMGKEREGARRRTIFRDYQVNQSLIAKAKEDTLVMHCLPAHRGEEITEEVLEGEQCVAFDQAENKLHIHKAILAKHIS